MPVGVGIGVSLGLLITLTGAVLTAWLLVSGKMSEDMIGYCAMAILFLASVFGSWVAALQVKRQRFHVCLITGVSYYLVLVSITALFFGGQYQGMGVTAILVGVGNLLTVLIGLKGKKRAKPGIRKRTFC